MATLIITVILSVIPVSAGSLTVNAITPSTGINITTITIMNLVGTGFIPGASVILTPVNVNPVHRGSIVDGGGVAPFLDNTYDVFVSNHYAYVTSIGSNALEVIDISNPALPVHTGSIAHGAGGALLERPYSVFVSGNYAYIASAESNALEIIDVSNPAIPVHHGSIINGTGGALLEWLEEVRVSGNYAYVASYYCNAIEIVDVTDPANPVHVSSISDGNGLPPCMFPETTIISQVAGVMHLKF